MLCFYNNEQPYNYYSNSDEEELVEEEKRMKEIYNWGREDDNNTKIDREEKPKRKIR